jgi:UDP-3-O-[3-hydroxymyristoyl] glucosamine N-acyltransferase
MANEGVDIIRQDPLSFIDNFDPMASYINLVITDIPQRRQISQLIDDRQLKRFSYIHQSSTVNGTIELGCFIYPSTVIYANSYVECDTIIHSLCVIAHYVSVGKGSYFSAGVLVGGTATLGKFNKYMLGVVIHDKITICDDVTIGTKAVVRKNITAPGIYSPVSATIEKIK